MFGWEFPPHVSGGLGVACEGLVRGLLELETEVALVLPFARHRQRHGAAQDHLLLRRRIGGEGDGRGPPGPRCACGAIRESLEALRDRGRSTKRSGARRDAPGPRSSRTLRPRPPTPRSCATPLRPARIAAREILRRHPCARLADVPGGDRGAARERQAPRAPRPRHRVRPHRRRAATRSWRRSSGSASRPPTASSPSRATPPTSSAERYGVPAERLRVVHNAIDAQASGRRAWSVEEEEPLVLFAGPHHRRRRDPSTSWRPPRASPPRCRRVKFAVAGLRRSAAADDGARRLARALRPLPLHGLPAAGAARPPLRARRRLRDALGLGALRPDGARGAPARHARHRFADRGRLAKSCATCCAWTSATSRASRARSCRCCSFPPLRDTLGSRGRAEVERLSWREVGLALPHRLPRIGGTIDAADPQP